MSNLIFERPTGIEQLGTTLNQLVTYGGARVSNRWQTYLRSVGTAQAPDGGEWMWPTQHFLLDAMPAANTMDLIRRVLVRDPLYRMHLDLCLISVLHSIAIAERWKRLEEILFDACRPVASRLMQLLDWQMTRLATPARNLSVADWNRTSEEIIGEYEHTFLVWDRYLWGDCRRVAELFPVLLQLYVPICDQPVHVFASDDQFDAAMRSRLSSIINAACEGEGVVLPTSELELLARLQNCGIPIRIWIVDGKYLKAHLVGRVTCELGMDESRGELTQVPSGLPTVAKRSYLVGHTDYRPPTEWSAFERNAKTAIALYSLPSDSSRWPAQSSDDHPAWLPLPGAETLATAGKRRTDSPDADQALSQIAEHSLYGFMLQLLLLEALDRELGEETVVLALPQNHKLESFEDWAGTKLLYRPREEKAETEIRSSGFLELGYFDEVIETVAHEVGIRLVTPYTIEGGGPWSRTLALMNTAGLIDGRPDRWILTITSYILDRLHSGPLMKDVIRGGRGVRDKIHEVLTTLWQQQSKVEIKEELPA